MAYVENNVIFAAKVGQLAEFKSRHGHCDIPKNHDDQVLARWVRSQRLHYSGGNLSSARIAMLDAIGFNFTAGLRGTTLNINQQLSILMRYRRETGGDTPSKSDANLEYAGLSQWIYRIRKLHHGGQLSVSAIELIENAGITLERTPKRAEALQEVADAAFQENYERLSNWLDHAEDISGVRNLAYRDTKNNEEAKKAYRFVEHMALKSRQAILSDAHHTQLCLLGFSINGRSIEDFLTPKPSIRSPEGALISRATRHAEKALQEAQEVVLDAEATAQKAEEVRTFAEAKLDDALKTLRQLASAPPPVSPQQEAPIKRYLSTEELAVRINYDARTIRERLKDSVLLSPRHYIRPFGGRKLLWVWENINADMQDGTFRLLEAASAL